MTRRFPHLPDATAYPYANERVYSQYPATFDYTRWESQTQLKPCTVRWTIDSDDRVKWESDTARDTWFDGIGGRTYTLDSGLNVIPDESVRLPIPYQAMQFANYLAVTIPDMPDADKQLDYSEQHLARLYYFVLDTRRINASVTECVLALDYWTTYINSVNIARIMVERGHVAQSYETVTSYFTDPIHNTYGLTAPEPDAPAAPALTASNSFVPLATGEMWLLMAVKCTYTQFVGLTQVGAEIPTTAPAYADTSDYYGHQYQVNDYQWGGVPNLNGVTTPNATGVSADNIRPNGYAIIGLKTVDAFGNGFFDKLTASLPQAWNLIEACYVVPRNMINPTSGAKLLGFDVYRITPAATGLLANIDLQPGAFGYPERYAHLAKLYTAPYAWLSITDENNNESVVRVEDTTGDLGVMRRVSLAYPYLAAQTFINGVSGSGHAEYTWADLTDTSHTTDIPDGAFCALSTHEIPLFTLMIDNAVKYVNDNDSQARVQARENALNAYHVSTRNTNTGLVTGTANADTNVANTKATSDNAIANTKIKTDTATANNTQSNTAATNTQNASVDKINKDYSTGSDKMINDLLADQNLAGLAANASNDTRAATTVSSLVGQSAAIGAGALLSGGTMGAAAVAGAAISAATTGYNTGVVIDNNEQLIATQQVMMANKADYANNANRDYRDHATDLIKATTSINIALSQGITDNENSANTRTTDNNAATANANAERSRNTTLANLAKNRDAGTFAAQTALKQAQDMYAAKIRDMKRSAPATMTARQGDALPDIWGTRGLQVRVMTQSPDIIRRCGDAFLRYGYTLHENVETPNLLVKTHFTYWKGDALVYATNAPSRAVNEITELLRQGVTVWRNPDTIGHSIYDND